MAAIPAFQLGTLSDDPPYSITALVDPADVALPSKSSGLSFIPAPVVSGAGGGDGGEQDAVGYAG